MSEADKQQKKHLPQALADNMWQKGQSGNPNGRPPGQTLKEYWQKRFRDMSDEERLEFTKKVGNVDIWKMAEGLPKQDHEIGGKDGEPITFKWDD